MSYEINVIDLCGVNCYLIKTQKGFILVDTAGPMFLDQGFQSRRDLLEKSLQNYGCTKENLELIILTHGDCDHTFNALHINKQYDAPIAMHEADLSLAQNLDVEGILKGCNYKKLVYKIFFRLMNKKICIVSRKIVDEFMTFTPDIILKEGDRLDEYGLAAQIVHIPGHTPGSIAVLTDKGDCICGDIFANMKKPQVALNAVNFTEMYASVKKLNSYSFTKVYPGHGKPYNR